MKRLTLWTAAIALVVSPMAALADDDVEAKMRAMEARMADLETKLDSAADQLEAANDRLEAQQEVIDQVEVDSSSGLSAFLDTVEIGGWVSASYFYSWDDVAKGRNQPGFQAGDRFGTIGANPAIAPGPSGSVGAGLSPGGWAYPFHPDTNTFSMDQFWMEIERAVSEENRAGFRADLVYGKTGGILSGTGADGTAGSSNDFNLYQAYVQYLAPVGEGIHFKAGKFATLIGAEVTPTAYNYNITRGHVFNLMQPINHVGILMSMPVGPVDLSLGWANETRAMTDTDTNRNKAVMGAIGGGGEVFGWQLAGIYGDAARTSITNVVATPNCGGTSAAVAATNGVGVPAGTCPTRPVKADDKEWIADLILSFSPTENFEAYINATYIETQNGSIPAGLFLNSPAGATTVSVDDTEGWGVAAAGRFGVTERLGLALRAEYVDIEDWLPNQLSSNFNPFMNGGGGILSGFTSTASDLEVWGITGTVDYRLSENLTVKVEARYDDVLEGTNQSSRQPGSSLSDEDLFINGSTGTAGESDQFTTGVEVIYSF